MEKCRWGVGLRKNRWNIVKRDKKMPMKNRTDRTKEIKAIKEGKKIQTEGQNKRRQKRKNERKSLYYTFFFNSVRH